MYRYKIIKEGGPSQADLDNYLSVDADYSRLTGRSCSLLRELT
jgi:hypothetical protein